MCGHHTAAVGDGATSSPVLFDTHSIGQLFLFSAAPTTTTAVVPAAALTIRTVHDVYAAKYTDGNMDGR